MEEPAPLAEQAEKFASDMTGVLVAVLDADIDIRPAMLEVESGPRFVIANGISEGEERPVEEMWGDPIIFHEAPELALRVHWTFGPNSTGQWIKVIWSRYGLYVQARKGKWTPFVRLEVDPTKDEWLSSHYHVTAESELLGYICGVRGLTRKHLHHLHLPVGGFRFRPCLEDFLEFIIDHGLVPGRAGWREALQPTREEYRMKQFRTMVTKHPDEAQAELDRMKEQ